MCSTVSFDFHVCTCTLYATWTCIPKRLQIYGIHPHIFTNNQDKKKKQQQHNIIDQVHILFMAFSHMIFTCSAYLFICLSKTLYGIDWARTIEFVPRSECATSYANLKIRYNLHGIAIHKKTHSMATPCKVCLRSCKFLRAPWLVHNLHYNRASAYCVNCEVTIFPLYKHFLVHIVYRVLIPNLERQWR